ncbi:hypothetical protein BJ912DRAFT_1048318 [Pholiota molesta]|nr:hypothetical protein BJ912DRAFT_1048318 [Pholiota molesta]
MRLDIGKKERDVLGADRTGRQQFAKVTSWRRGWGTQTALARMRHQPALQRHRPISSTTMAHSSWVAMDLGEGVVLENWISCRRAWNSITSDIDTQRCTEFRSSAFLVAWEIDLQAREEDFHHSDFQLPDSHPSIMGLYNSTCLTPTRELLNFGCTRSERHRRLVGRATGVATAHGAQDKAAEAQRHFVAAVHQWRLASTQRAVFKNAAPRTPQTCPGALAIMDPQVTGVEETNPATYLCLGVGWGQSSSATSSELCPALALASRRSYQVVDTFQMDIRWPQAASIPFHDYTTWGCRSINLLMFGWTVNAHMQTSDSAIIVASRAPRDQLRDVAPYPLTYR